MVGGLTRDFQAGDVSTMDYGISCGVCVGEQVGAGGLQAGDGLSTLWTTASSVLVVRDFQAGEGFGSWITASLWW